ncbi:HD domain-containing phosphohydrolase [Oceanisphaera arctica]|uniref:HD-GYP domain-containing protein n=2 Tax=Oceanisphaera arctica TaxID=641510 RepID=A0A2P5TMY4_9GAMM|nr:HD domain-containing phosphohydrolase [Oceanisphaera arctica]PPL16819.1 hypothetical protein UN63_07395 [Oceanisphaera arctica]GHA06163.1 hypothetical protein GCM10007082_03950 [Oceanisphaera arctica]
MDHADNDFTPVVNRAAIQSLLDTLTQPGGASLLPEQADSRLLPVVVVEQQPGQPLLLDISAIRELAFELIKGLPFRLLGHNQDGILRTLPMTLRDCREVEGRLQGYCDYPAELELMQRRSSFRARLRIGMAVGVSLRPAGDEPALQGDLKDLSLAGCRVEFSLVAGMADMLGDGPLSLELCFPGGQHFAIEGEIRHRQADNDRQVITVGFEFTPGTPERERRLWFLVREIEREAARNAVDDQGSLLPSTLFQADEAALAAVERRHTRDYATPMARRLARLAAYLDLLQLELRQDGRIDSRQLSRHADLLLSLLDEDREALLFATVCLDHEPPLVRHCLSVAVRLVDLVGVRKIPGELRKALAASALVHDLGKALLPAELLGAASLADDQYQQLKAHVTLLQERLSACQWLAPAVLSAVVGGANERLDGSGYPRGMAGDMLHELSRLMAVVDTTDAMSRPRPDRSAYSIHVIYRYLLSQPQQYDERWVKRYMRHFGRWPIGALVRYGGGELAWVQRLDADKQPSQVQLTSEPVPPGPALGQVLRKRELAMLGPIKEIVVPAIVVPAKVG